MTIEECKNILESEGFLHIYEWKDEANAVYSSHAHKDKVVIFVTDGSVEFDFSGEKKIVAKGERFNVPAGVVHSAVTGIDGCHYVVGEMIEGDS